MPRPPDFPYLDLKDIQPRGRCDRGGEIRPKRDLKKEYVWAGDRLAWNGFLVCDEHRDPPHPQDKPLVLKPDPVPIENPRPDIDRDTARYAYKNPDGSFILGDDGDYILASTPQPDLPSGTPPVAPLGPYLAIGAVAPMPWARVLAQITVLPQLSVSAITLNPAATVSAFVAGGPALVVRGIVARPTAQVTAKRGERLSIAATVPVPVAHVSAAKGERISTIAALVAKPVASALLIMGVSRALSVAATAPKPSASVSAKRGEQLSVAAVAPKPIASVSVQRGERISAIAATAPKPSASASLGTVPVQVTGLALGTATDTTQALTWNAAFAATSYEVQFSCAGFGGWLQATASNATTSYTVAALLDAGISYDYRVRGVNSVGSGAWSALVTGSTTTSNALPFITGMIARYKAPVNAGLFSDTAKTSRSGTTSSSVAVWADLSGNGMHLSQSTGTLQPIRQTGQVNGQSEVRFSFSSGTIMTATDSALVGPMHNGGLTVVCVQKIMSAVSSASASVPWSIGSAADSGTSINNFHFENPTSVVPTTLSLARYAANTSGTKVSATGYTPPVFVRTVCRFDRTNKQLKMDISGSAFTATQTITDYTTGLNAWDSLSVGNFLNNPRPADSQIYEVIFYDHLFTDQNVTDMQTYLVGEYGT